MKDDEIEKYWIQYLKQNCKKELGRIKAHYPLDRTLTIDLSKVLHNGLWQECIDRPRACMLAIEEAFQNGFYNGENKVVPIIRFISLPKKKPIRDLRAEDEGKLLAISCLVKRVSPVLPKILKSTWKCSEYHTETVKARYDHIEKPKYCRTCKSKSFTYHGELDEKVNRQWIHVQENLDDLMGGLQPSTLRCEVVDDLCNQVGGGDCVILNGFLRSIPKFDKEGLKDGKDIYFDVNSIEQGENEVEGIEPTEAEDLEIKALAKREDIFDLLTDSIAPSVMGMRLAKQAIVLQLIGGVARTLPDGTRKRGFINVLIITDPSMAKTELLLFVNRVAVRSSFAVADTSSKVGLVAPIIRDEQTGQFVIEPGPYLLARGGIFCLDEIGNLSKEDWKYIGECMENGQCHIAKGGINVTLKSDAALLGAGNPTGGCYEVTIPFAQQIKVPEQNLSRTDIKILQTDDISEGRDRELAAHMGRTFRKDFVVGKEFIRPELLRKFIWVAQSFEPEITEAASKVFEDYYVKMRAESRAPGVMRMTLRQFNSLVYMGEAYTRAHHRKQVTVKDATAVIEIYDMAYRNINTDSNGQLNPGRSEHKTRESLQNLIRKTITEIGGETKKATELSVITALKKKGYDSDRVAGVIQKLLQEGRLSEPTNGLLKVE